MIASMTLPNEAILMFALSDKFEDRFIWVKPNVNETEEEDN